MKHKWYEVPFFISSWGWAIDKLDQIITEWKNNMVTKQELLPCRICKSKTSQISRSMGRGKWIIYCNSCGDGRAEVIGRSKEEAEDKWNNLME